MEKKTETKLQSPNSRWPCHRRSRAQRRVPGRSCALCSSHCVQFYSHHNRSLRPLERAAWNKWQMCLQSKGFQTERIPPHLKSRLQSRQSQGRSEVDGTTNKPTSLPLIFQLLSKCWCQWGQHLHTAANWIISAALTPAWVLTVKCLQQSNITQ